MRTIARWPATLTRACSPAEFEAELPVVALTCIDSAAKPAACPQVLGILPEHFIWLRNAGNIITGPAQQHNAVACRWHAASRAARKSPSSVTRIASAGKTTTMELPGPAARAWVLSGIMLPENLNEFFGHLCQ